MPTPTPFASAHNQPVFPALYLYPLNDSFVPKHITLLHNQRVKIGRQTNAKTSPAERNGYFDSKVLSRQHAEVWEEGGKIFIKDVKSSNGTFINGDRLSPEGLESEPFQLNSDDIVEFGIDIVGEDNKTIIHHKVAARVVCVFSEQDAQIAARAEQHQHNGMAGQAGPSGASTFNFQNPSSQRRPPLQQQGLAGMGGMGGSMRPPGKSGLTFDHILSRLQGELQKSRETGAELSSLTTAMNDIHDTLGGQLPSNLPQYPQVLPPVRSGQTSSSSPAPHDPQPEQAPPIPALNEIQTQLHDTQSSLSTHMDRIRALEGVLAEHEAIKREVSALRELMEERRRSADGSGSRDLSVQEGQNEDLSESDDDDARSVDTMVPRQLDPVDEEDEDQLAAEEDEDDRRRRREELGRPRTPEPSSLGMTEEDFERQSSLLPSSSRRSPSPDSRKSASLIDELTTRLNSLAEQLESAILLSSNLQAQHAAAQSTISALEGKVSVLESLVHATQAQTAAQGLAHDQSIREAATAAAAAAVASIPSKEDTRESLTQMLSEWKRSVEGQWSNVQEEWHQERERLHRAREEWENKFKAIEIGMNTAVAKVDSGLASINLTRVQRQPNGDAHGLATPPSPSLSHDSRSRIRKRKVASRGRSRSRSRSQPRTDGSGDLTDSSTAVSLSGMHSSHSSKIHSPNSDNESDTEGRKESRSDSTPNGHVLASSIPSSHTQWASDEPMTGEAFDLEKYPMTTQAALGVVVLGVAAAAVIWRVRPE